MPTPTPPPQPPPPVPPAEDAVATLRSAFSPVGWEPSAASGVWFRTLPTMSGDRFALWRAGPGATMSTSSDDGIHVLVLRGSLDVTGDATLGVRRRGDWFPASGASMRSEGGSLLLTVTGPGLGAGTHDAFGPAGWFTTGPGQWARLLVDLPVDGALGERVAGLSWMERGSASPRHPHRTRHRFLFLEGAAEDEVVHPDGRRETARRGPGDFVDYPAGVEHQSFTRDGCLILFVHDLSSPSRPPAADRGGDDTAASAPTPTRRGAS